MSAGKSLNTGNSLYSNITRALSGDLVSCQLRSLFGAGGDTAAQPAGIIVTDAVSFASSWTAIQGIARNTNNWFAIDTTALRRYSSTGTLLNTNSAPFVGLPATLDHCGDGEADDSFLYTAISNYVGATQTATTKVIAKYNASDITLHSYFDLSALPADFNASGLCLSPDGSEFWVTSYNTTDADIDSTRKIWRVNATTGAYIGQYSLGARVRGCQGIAYRPNSNAVYITSWNGTDSYIYAFDATTFDLLQRIDPTNINSGEEIEGVICYENKIYINKINDAPRVLSENMLIPSSLTSGDPALFVSAAQLSEAGTILIRWRPITLPTLQTVFDNTTNANTWECWVNSSGTLSWRVSNATPRCDYAGIAARTEYIIAMTWSRSGANVDIKLGVNGVYRSTATHAWTAIPTGGLWLGGGNTGNSQADAEFKDVIVFNKVLSDAELLDTYSNFSSLYTTGSAYTLTADGSLYAISGGESSTLYGRCLFSDGSLFNFQGGVADLLYGRALQANGGSFSYSGGVATFVYNPITGYVLNADGGIFSYAGDEAALSFNQSYPIANPNNYTVSARVGGYPEFNAIIRQSSTINARLN